eukprot:scaffold223_cov145-Amphora_coffeaeformis.AAC.9
MDASWPGEEASQLSSDLRDEVLAIVAALVSGVRYGIKIRLPHALVMTFMFRRDLSTKGKLRLITDAVLEHARSLGSFALIYKTTLVLLKLLQRKYDEVGRNASLDPTVAKSFGRILINMIVPPPPIESPEYGIKSIPSGRPEQKFHALVAGALGGYVVWGSWSPISHQVLMYISIRVLAGLWKLLPVHDDAHWRTTHRLACTVAWAAVMYLWETYPDVLQSSMRKSMEEIYNSGLFGGGRRAST